MQLNINYYKNQWKSKKILKENPNNKFLQSVLNNTVQTLEIFKKTNKNKQGHCEIILPNNIKLTYNYQNLTQAISVFKKYDQNSFFTKSFIYILNLDKIKLKDQEKIVHLLSAVKFTSLLVTNYISKKDKIKKNNQTRDVFIELIRYEISKYSQAMNSTTDDLLLTDYLEGKKKNDYELLMSSFNNINKYTGYNNWKIGNSIMHYLFVLLQQDFKKYFDREISAEKCIKYLLEYGFLKGEYDLFLNKKEKLQTNIFDFLTYNNVSQILLILSDYLRSSINQTSYKYEEILRWITETNMKVRLSDDPPMNWYQWTNLFIKYAFLIFWCIIILYPIILFIKAAFNGENGSLVDFKHFFFSINGFQTLFAKTDYLQDLSNSLIISIVTMILTTFFAGLTAFAFSRFKFKGKRGYFASFLILQLLPTFTGVIVYYIFTQVLADTFNLPSYISLIIIYTGGGVVGNTLIIKSYMDSISHEIDDAAIIDGCSYSKIYFKIIFPLSLPILTLVALWSFTGPFSDVIIPNIVINNQSDYTVALLLYQWIVPPDNNAANISFIWYIDGGLLIAVPISIVFIILQKFVVEGMSLGGVKE